MTFIYFACEFYWNSNAIACETLILNYNGKFNLGICPIYFFLFTYSYYDFSNLLFYIYLIFKFFYLTLRFD